MKKILTILFGLLLVFFLPKQIFAAGEFDISTNSTYTVSDDGNTNVRQVVAIKNNTEFTYTPQYTISSAFKDIRNLRVYNSAGSIDSVLKENSDGQKSIEITFGQRVVGLGNINQFTVEFNTNEVATQKGNIWEISIPGIADPSDFTDYNISLSVPASFGEPSIVKPPKTLTSAPYRFDKDQTGTAGVYILFGSEQYYKLNLAYHIENLRVVPVKTEIAIPSNTSYQEVRLDSIEPKPTDMYEDGDGNWLAVYELSPREKMTVNAEVIVKVYSEPRFEADMTPESLSSAKYWEASDLEIQKLAKELATPRAIYDYVVDALTYNYEKVSDQNIRIGAAEVLARPDFAVCLEFTDLFVALARAAGIPARSVEGYAFTDDSKLRPLSLVADVLHSWPEYYDSSRNTWVYVDPTWGNTTRGVDYFTSFDFDHIAFIEKGKDSSYPIPAGGYKANGNTKDVQVELANESDFQDIVKSDIEINIPDNAFSGLGVSGAIEIKNNGNVPILGQTLKVTSDLNPSVMEFTIDKILPYETASIPVEFEKTQFLTNRDYSVTILFAGASKSKVVAVNFIPDTFFLILGGVIIIGSITISYAAYKTWRIYLQRQKR